MTCPRANRQSVAAATLVSRHHVRTKGTTAEPEKKGAGLAFANLGNGAWDKGGGMNRAGGGVTGRGTEKEKTESANSGGRGEQCGGSLSYSKPGIHLGLRSGPESKGRWYPALVFICSALLRGQDWVKVPSAPEETDLVDSGSQGLE